MKKIYRYLWLLMFVPFMLSADTITLSGTLRDFHDYSKHHDKNPDFENKDRLPSGSPIPLLNQGNYAVVSLVNETLTNGLPTLANHGNGTVDNVLGATLHSITDANSFAQWFTDVDGINQSMPYDLTLTKQGDVYIYDSQTDPKGSQNQATKGFFPLDGQGFGNECKRNGQDKCINSKKGYWKNDHNYHFTYQIHSQFTYKGGETFEFSGDDDVWVFINGKLAVDVGGIHSRVVKSIDLDDEAQKLGITKGGTYSFDFFFAERHVTGANLKITTSIGLEQKPELIAEYRFDECSWNGTAGEVKDSSGSNDATTYMNVATTEGVINRAASFTGGKFGETGQIKVTPDFNLSNEFTISFWINADDSNETAGVLSKTIDVYITGDKKLNVKLNNGNSTITDSALSGRTHVTLTKGGGEFKIYLNGVLNKTIGTGFIHNRKNDIVIGGVQSVTGLDAMGDRAFKGQLDELKFFNGSLSGTEIQNMYNNEKSGKNWDGTTRDPVNCTVPPPTTEGICYALDDTKSKLYKVNMSPGANPLPVAQKINLQNVTKSLNGEAGAYNSEDGLIYGFHEGSDYPTLYSIEPASGQVTKVSDLTYMKKNVTGAAFYGGYFYVLAKKHLGKNTLYKIDTSNWSLISKKDLNGDIKEGDGLAINKNGNAYIIYDNRNKIYTINLTNAKTTYLTQIKTNTEAEALSFAKDGNIYTENSEYETSKDTDKLFKINLSDGSLTEAAQIPHADDIDIESLSCNTEVASTPPKINITAPSQVNIIEGNSGTKAVTFTLTADKTIPGDMSFNYSFSNGSATKGSDYQDGSLSFAGNTITISNVIIGDKKVEPDEYFDVNLSSCDSRVHFTNSTTRVNIINDDENHFTCTADSYLTTNHDLYSLNLDNGENSPLKMNYTTDSINGIGYNVKDNFIWGWDMTQKKVMRLDADYTVKLYDTDVDVSNIDINIASRNGFTSGDVSKDGILYLAKPSMDHKIHKFDLNSGEPVYEGSVALSDQTIHFGDFAVNPVDNYLYTVADKKLCRINPENGQVTKFGEVSGIDGGGYFHSFVFDKDGNMYFYSNDNHKHVFKLDLSDFDHPDTTADTFGTLDWAATNGDGARCANAAMEPKPTLTISDVSHKEGQKGTQTDFAFNVSLSEPAPVGMSFWYTVTDGSDGDQSEYAGAVLDDHDMVGISGCIEVTDTDRIKQSFDVYGSHGDSCQEIPKGVTSIVIHTNVNGDNKIEPDERFFMDIYSPDKAIIADSRGDGIILNDDYNVTLNAVTLGDIFDGKLTTQIVNKPFALKIGAFYENNNSVVSGVHIVGLDIVDKSNHVKKTLFAQSESIMAQFMNMMPFGFGSFMGNPSQNSVPDIVTGTNGTVMQNFNIDKASKEYRLKITGIYQGKKFTSISRDTFSVRPKAYKLTLPTDLVAGKDFNITIHANDINGVPVTNYAESTSVKLDINESKAGNGCKLQTIVLPNLQFHQGIAQITTKYSDIGQLDFKVHEVNGSEYAYVDKDDTNNTLRYIMPDSTPSGIIKPFNINLSKELHNGGGQYTYFGSDPSQMGAQLKVGLQITNKQGVSVKNFSPQCYAKDVNIAMDYNLSNKTRTYKTVAKYDINSTLKDQNMAFTPVEFQDHGTLSYKMEKEYFKDGNSSKTVKFNFERNASMPLNPLNLKLGTLNVSIPNYSLSTQVPLDKTLTFLYARAHAPDQQAVGKEINALIYYEAYCKGCNRDLYGDMKHYKESVDAIRWYILPSVETTKLDISNNVSGEGSVSEMTPGNIIAHTSIFDTAPSRTDHNHIEIKVKKSPAVTKINYKPDSYLIFNLFNENATSQSFRTRFSEKPKTWAGKGAQGHTVDMDVSKLGINKIDW